MGAVSLAVVPFGCPGYIGGEQKPFQALKGCHLQLAFCTAAVVTRPGGMCFLDRIKSSVKLSARKKNKLFFILRIAPPSDVPVQLKVTTAGLVHGTLGAVIYCASSHWHARMDSQTHKSTVPAANPGPPPPTAARAGGSSCF